VRTDIILGTETRPLNLPLPPTRPHVPPEMFQKITSTDFNRYPGIFRTAAAMMEAQHGADMRGGRLKILSFGCSEGQEMQSIRCYFPDVRIFGCDVNKTVLRMANKAVSNDRLSHVFLSNEENIIENGPYDLVFAMSVFCQYPESKKFPNIQDLYPFSLFQQLAGTLCDNMVPGGLFCLMNSNYLFRQTRMASRFRAIRSPLQGGNGFIDKFDQNGDRLTTSFGSKRLYSHRREGAGIDDDDLIDCMYQLIPDGAPSPAPWLIGGEPTAVNLLGEEIQLAGECLTRAIEEKRAAMSLVGRFGVDARGGGWEKRWWRRSTLDGAVIEMAPFWRKVEKNHALEKALWQQQAKSLNAYLAEGTTLSQRLRSKVLGRLGLRD
jgi:hypothetical protein